MQCQPIQHLPLPSDDFNMNIVSSAPVTPVNERCPMGLTPPSTPLRLRRERAPASDRSDFALETSPATKGLRKNETGPGSKTSIIATAEERLGWEMTIPMPCTKTYQRQGSEYAELGHGAWSTVYRATECYPPQPLPLLTPPSSPACSLSKPVISRILAVKTAARRDAQDVLHHEARVLTYLHSSPKANLFLVPFHGYDTASQGLVMDAVPLNLDTYARSCLSTARLQFSTRTMFDPVCGVSVWQSLATQLINGLAFLHNESCIHGDIKPANILLRPNGADSAEAYTALYCDFSSSRIFDSEDRRNSHQAEQLTALTPDFVSPELFHSLGSTAAVATLASDVYALGVTLIVAAIGSSPYASATMDIQKLSMAREGRVLDFAGQSEQGTRVMKGKMVERCLRGALTKDAGRRSTVGEWKRDVETVPEELS